MSFAIVRTVSCELNSVFVLWCVYMCLLDELKKSNDEKVSGILNNPLGLAVLKGDTSKVRHLLNDKVYRNLLQETDSEGNSM